MSAVAGRTASGWNSSATSTGGIHATNGPKNGIAIRMPGGGRRSAPTSGRPKTTLVTIATRK